MESALLAEQVISQLAFLAPERLLILLTIPVLILAYIFASLRKNRRGMRFTNTSMLDVGRTKAVAVAASPRCRALAVEFDHPDGGLCTAEDPD